MRLLFLSILSISSLFLAAQSTPTISSLEESRSGLREASLINNLPYSNIGPTVQSGRVSSIAVDPDNSHHFYVAYASGGLWETHNNGTSFLPLFDQEAVMTIGAINVDWSSGKIWVATGEVNSSRSSYAGVGVYSSADDGETWDYLGLPESHHIGKIISIDSMTAVVGVLGHLYTQNEERGIYKTTDGGKSWEHSLAINDSTGVVDIIQDPSADNIFYAASWQRDRKAWNFTEAGSASAIYKSTDSGDSWVKISTPGAGFPTHDQVGRIGLSMAHVDGVSTLYAFLDNYNRRMDSPIKEGLQDDAVSSMSNKQLLRQEEKLLKSYIKGLGLPKKYTYESVIAKLEKNEITAEQLSSYNKDANRLLFDTPVIGAELYKSTDEGASWSRTHEDFIDGLVYSYGYYFGQVRVNPKNQEEVYIMGVPILKSIDGGKTFKSINGKNVHVDHHALWINPNNPDHLINGNDGGINISYDGGEHWIKCNTPAVGQFYYANVDSLENYNVYGGLQDNGVWRGSHRYKPTVAWHQTGRYPYERIMGGDGMQIQIDPRNADIVYTGYQFGNYFRLHLDSGDRSYITPRHDLGDAPYRWNWQSPILISPHNADIIYLGANKLFRSFDKGNHFDPISGELTYGGKKGDVPYGTLTSITESPFQFGLLYTGSDDGKVFRSVDAGSSWTDISPENAKDLWVSRVIASSHDQNRIYLSLNGYRNDDFSAYLYRSDDAGDTWIDISTSLPSEPINVIKEDPNDADVIYVGTDHGTYASIDQGSTFMTLGAEIPRAPVHDLVIQKQHKDLIIATHGRSLYKVDITSVSKLKNLDKQLVILDNVKLNYRSTAGKVSNSYDTPISFTAQVEIFSKVPATAKIELRADTGVLIEKQVALTKGYNQVELDLKVDKKNEKKLQKWINKLENKEEYKVADDGYFYLVPGKYDLQVTTENGNDQKNLTIKTK